MGDQDIDLASDIARFVGGLRIRGANVILSKLKNGHVNIKVVNPSSLNTQI